MKILPYAAFLLSLLALGLVLVLVNKGCPDKACPAPIRVKDLPHSALSMTESELVSRREIIARCGERPPDLTNDFLDQRELLTIKTADGHKHTFQNVYNIYENRPDNDFSSNSIWIHHYEKVGEEWKLLEFSIMVREGVKVNTDWSQDQSPDSDGHEAAQSMAALRDVMANTKPERCPEPVSAPSPIATPSPAQ